MRYPTTVMSTRMDTLVRLYPGRRAGQAKWHPRLELVQPVYLLQRLIRPFRSKTLFGSVRDH